MHLARFRKRLLRQRRFRQLLLGSVLLCVWLGFMIVPVERSDPQASITSVEEGIWWSVQTLTTIGYGDVVPVTTMGRFLGIVLQVMGTIMFGSLIAVISTSMSRVQEEHYWNRLFERLNAQDDQIHELKRHISFMVQKDDSVVQKDNSVGDSDSKSSQE